MKRHCLSSCDDMGEVQFSVCWDLIPASRNRWIRILASGCEAGNSVRTSSSVESDRMYRSRKRSQAESFKQKVSAYDLTSCECDMRLYGRVEKNDSRRGICRKTERLLIILFHL